jgi:hypothetical protein
MKCGVFFGFSFASRWKYSAVFFHRLFLFGAHRKRLATRAFQFASATNGLHGGENVGSVATKPFAFWIGEFIFAQNGMDGVVAECGSVVAHRAFFEDNPVFHGRCLQLLGNASSGIAHGVTNL